CFFFSSRRRHTRFSRDWSSDVCSSDLGVVAEPFFRWLLTEKWLPAVPYFQLILIAGIFQPIHKYNLNICNLKGRSDIVLKLSLLRNTLLLLGAISSFWYGIYALLYSLIFVNVLVTLINAYFSGKLIGYDLKNQLSDLFSILILNLLLGLTFYFIQNNWSNKLSDIWNLVINGIGFFALYFVLSFMIRMKVVFDLLSFIRK